MKGKIKDSQISHLALHLETLYRGPSLRELIRKGIRIPLSDASLDEEKVFFISGLPVLFPLSEKKEWFRLAEAEVIFHHDILKSAFYLLSGYQEANPDRYDTHGRFAWKHSIQYRLGFAGTAVVNHYFDILMDAIEEYCRISGQEFSRNTTQKPELFLSHDLDRIRKYTLRNTVHTFLHIFQTGHGSRSIGGRSKVFMDHLSGWLLSRKDPYHNYEKILEQEKELGIRSTWFLLEKRGAKNSKYHFNDPGIRELVLRLVKEGHEVGLHGTLESSGNTSMLRGELDRLRAICGEEIPGCRQHFLKYRVPESTRAQEEAGLSYDASLGFAEHTGFRHSYALPFRLYDFEKEESMEMQHLPLLVMDVSMLEYMGTGVEDLESVLQPVLDETRRFNGVFSLLWHNCRLDEEEYPGIGAAYRKILERILAEGFESRCGREIVKKEK